MKIGGASHSRGASIAPVSPIYDRINVNYVDESGLTHFHAACVLSFDRLDIVKKFLDSGLDPILRVGTTGDTPLHLAMSRGYVTTVELLLRRGADPNSVNNVGDTPLHLICKEFDNDYVAEAFFKTCDEVNQSVLIDIPDRSGQTPLQWAVSTLQLDIVDMLLARGADLSNFAYPAEISELCVLFELNIKFCLATIALKIFEHLKKREHELNPSDAVKIMKFFANYEMFEEPMDLENSWYDDEEFTTKAKKIKLGEDLSLYDLTRLRPEQVEKQLTLENYRSILLSKLTEEHKEACYLHLCEKLWRRFFRRWALDAFWQLIRYRLPILCCDMVVEELMNKDLYHICLAAAD